MDNDVETVKDLIAMGMRADAKDDNNRTALFTAAAGGSIEIMQTLLEAGCPVDVIDKQLWVASSMAASRGQSGSLKLLYEAKADFMTERGPYSKTIAYTAV